MDLGAVFQFFIIIGVVLFLCWGSVKLVSISKDSDSALAGLSLAYIVGTLFCDMVVTDTDVKEVFRIIGTAMRYVESEFMGESNETKEKLVIDIVLSSLRKLFPDSVVDEEVAVRLIRLSVAFPDSTYGNSRGVDVVGDFIKLD